MTETAVHTVTDHGYVLGLRTEFHFTFVVIVPLYAVAIILGGKEYLVTLVFNIPRVCCFFAAKGHIDDTQILLMRDSRRSLNLLY